MRTPDTETLPPELVELGELLREDRPRPSEPFAADLDARVAEGFPSDRTAREWLKPPRLLPALAGAATLLVAIVVAVSVNDDGMRTVPREDRTPAEGPTRPEIAKVPAAPDRTDIHPERARRAAPSLQAERARRAAPSAKAEGADVAATTVAPSPLPPSPGGGVAPRARTRRVERSASLTLAAPPDELKDVADGIVRTVDRHRGFVVSSTVSSAEEGMGGGSFDLRVPSSRLQAVLRDLSGLAHVRARSENTQDITRDFVTAQDRLADARAERRALLRRLGRAATANEVASIRAQLRLLRSRIARARGELNALRERSGYSTVMVTLEADESSESGQWGIDEALDDGLRVLTVALGVTLIAAAVLVPLAVLALLAALLARALLRRRRERALD